MEEKLRELLEQRNEALEKIGGCGDGGCVIHIRPGMHTNSHCQCARNRHWYELSQVIRINNKFATSVEDIIKKYGVLHD